MCQLKRGRIGGGGREGTHKVGHGQQGQVGVDNGGFAKRGMGEGDDGEHVAHDAHSNYKRGYVRVGYLKWLSSRSGCLVPH